MKINQESICICTRAVFSFSIYQRQKNKRFSFINFRYRLSILIFMKILHEFNLSFQTCSWRQSESPEDLHCQVCLKLGLFQCQNQPLFSLQIEALSTSSLGPCPFENPAIFSASIFSAHLHFFLVLFHPLQVSAAFHYLSLCCFLFSYLFFFIGCTILFSLITKNKAKSLNNPIFICVDTGPLCKCTKAQVLVPRPELR